MVNPIYTEPDPDNDLDPDIRNYSHHHQHNQLNRDQSPGSAQASSPTQQQQQHVYPPPLESNPLSFVSEKPTTAASNNHNVFNEKDYATGGYGYGIPTATTIGSMSETTAAGTTLNPSPTGPNLDRHASASTTRSSVHPDDEEPAFPFISWKQSAIVSSYLPFHLNHPHPHPSPQHLSFRCSMLTSPEHGQRVSDHLRSTDPAPHRMGTRQHWAVGCRRFCRLSARRPPSSGWTGLCH